MGVGHDRGRRGEVLAARFLERSGWQILDRNWRAGHSEVDLVIRRGGIVAFVEVKTRAHPGCGDPLEAVTWRKRREIARVAAAWLAARGPMLGRGVSVRFDAVAVQLGEGRAPVVRHLADAWRIGDP